MAMYPRADTLSINRRSPCRSLDGDVLANDDDDNRVIVGDPRRPNRSSGNTATQVDPSRGQNAQRDCDGPGCALRPPRCSDNSPGAGLAGGSARRPSCRPSRRWNRLKVVAAGTGGRAGAGGQRRWAEGRARIGTALLTTMAVNRRGWFRRSPTRPECSTARTYTSTVAWWIRLQRRAPMRRRR